MCKWRFALAGIALTVVFVLPAFGQNANQPVRSQPTYVVDGDTGYYYLPHEPEVKDIRPEDMIRIQHGDPRLLDYWPSREVTNARSKAMSNALEQWRQAWRSQNEAAWRAMAAADGSTLDTIAADRLVRDGQLEEAAQRLEGAELGKQAAQSWMGEFSRRRQVADGIWDANVDQVEQWRRELKLRMQGAQEE